MRGLFAAIIVFAVVGCNDSPSTLNKFSDARIRKIYDLADHRRSDSLLIYLESPEVEIRREAALVLGSVQDSVAALLLGRRLLEDKDDEVRRNAAFALGQTRGLAAVVSLAMALEDANPIVVAEALEALGKTAPPPRISSLTKFAARDTISLNGLGWGLYHLALRRMADSVCTRRAKELLSERRSYESALAAAHFFGRSASVTGTNFSETLIHAATTDASPEIRMAAASGLRHLPAASLLALKETILERESDYRVRVNFVRACQNLPLKEVQDIVFAALEDKDPLVAVAASEVIRNNADGELAARIEPLIPARIPRVSSNLIAAVLNSNGSEKIVRDVMDACVKAPDYEKSDLLSALGATRIPLQKIVFPFLAQELKNLNNSKVVVTSAASALVRLDRNAATTSRKEFLKEYQAAIALGDPAVTGIICGALTDEKLDYRHVISDITFLRTARSKLSLPRDVESIEPLEEAIAFLEGKPAPERPAIAFNHPIDWREIANIGKAQRATIETERGKIVIELHVEDAPGSVANFVSLASRGYFDGKWIHRVVPNFVIQAGCNRGDGFGSEDYSIRSEFPRRRYKTGSVGMASAGKDTEGTQWFITHCPTPHLDGKYSVFADVVSGIEVVHQSMVGDRITRVTLQTTAETP